MYIFISGGSQPSLAATNSSTSYNQKTSPDSPRVNKFNGSSGTSSPTTHSQLNDVLKKQMAGDFRNRGPPPQPPSLQSKNGSVQVSITYSFLMFYNTYTL